MNKSFRQGQILRLIHARKIHTQEQLAQELAGVGVATTQVTLSRDMRELGLAKTPEGYRQIAGVTPGPHVDSVVAEYLREIRIAQNQVVLKTPPGHANVLAAALDQADWPEIVGTVAGDDTVLVISWDNEKAAQLRQKLLSLMES